jgi:hypothetical protein
MGRIHANDACVPSSMVFLLGVLHQIIKELIIEFESRTYFSWGCNLSSEAPMQKGWGGGSQRALFGVLEKLKDGCAQR